MSRIIPSLLVSGIVFLAGAAAVHAASPDVQHLFPAGGQRGATVTVTVGGQLGDLPVEVWCSQEGVTAEIGDDEEAEKVQVTISPDAQAGLCWLRFYNAAGASALKPFIVGTLPEVLEEEPNDTTEAAQTLELDSSGLDSLGIVVNGILEKRDDVDTFAVSLKKGETLVASMVANETLGSPMDGLLQIVSPQGFVLEQNDDDQGLDPRIVFVADADGTYFVRTFAFPAEPNSTIRLAGAANYIYRLTITTGPFIDHPFPLAVTGGSTETVRIEGWNVPDELSELEVNADAEQGQATVEHPLLGNTAEVRVVPHAIDVEREPNNSEHPQPIELPVTISGRIDEPGDIDVYAFKATKGQKLTFRVESRSLGAPLDPVLRLFDSEGKSLREVDDPERGVFDSVLAHTIPADGEYHLHVADLHRDGGFRFVYRLTAELDQPDYTLALEADAFTLTPGEPVEIPVTVTRVNDFDEEIAVEATGLPAGVSAEPVRSTADDDETAESVKLVLKADADDSNNEAVWNGPIRVVGRSAGEGELQRTAEAPVGGLTAKTADVWLTRLPSKADAE